MLAFGIKIIFLLLLIGGTIAIAGNYIGRAIGRRRLTVFNLRPRHTAYAVTVLTGILIVLATLGVILIISHNARTALFGLEELRKNVAQKSALLEETKKELAQRIAEREKIKQELEARRAELTASKKELAGSRANLQQAKGEIAALEKTKEKLGRQVEVSRRGKVLFRVGEVLLTSLIQAGPEKNKLAAGLKQILSAADAYVRSFGIEKAWPADRQEKHLIFISPEEFNRAVAALKKRRGENIIAVTATRNTVFGEAVPVRFEVTENKLIYKSGEQISQALIAPSLSLPEIEQEIKKLLSLTHLSAKKAGVLPDASGSVGSVPYARIFALAKKIKAYRKGVKLKSLAKGDTYTIGPLDVTFKIFYQ